MNINIETEIDINDYIDEIDTKYLISELEYRNEFNDYIKNKCKEMPLREFLIKRYDEREFISNEILINNVEHELEFNIF